MLWRETRIDAVLRAGRPASREPERPPSFQTNLFWPLALLAFLAVGVVAMAGLALVREFDSSAKQREQAIVENSVSGHIRETAATAADEVVWDAAVENLDNHFNLEWAQQNIGTFFSPVRGFDGVFILAASGDPIFAAHAGVSDDTGSYLRFANDARSLVSSIRAAEERRGMIEPSTGDAELTVPPIQASSMASIDGELFILTATLVQPDFGKIVPLGPRAPIVLTVARFNEALIKTLAERNLIGDLHVRKTDGSRNKDDAHVLLRSDRGVPLAELEWHPQDPGRVILRRLGLPVFGILVLLAAGVLLLYQRSRRMAHGLVTSEARATHLAYYDALTGLPNRVLFFDRLGHALVQMQRTKEPLAVVCIDIDRLKGINDSYGQRAGDELIKEAAKRMAQQCRASETFARLSGDEFAVVQTKASTAAGAALATRLSEAMAQPFDLREGRVYVSCSVGICLVDEATMSAEEAVRQANLAVYRTKQTAKGKFCFYDLEMDTAVKTRRALESDLRTALALGDLYMVYQPQVNEAVGMFGVEALVRWQHPRRGPISPAFFVPIAEECGLIGELGMFTLRTAFLDSKRWKTLKVAVNVSANQLRVGDFPARIMGLVEETGVDPKRFELEITEGILLGDDPQIHATLQELRRLGFSLALDDFGTGYSSLSYLQRYPIDKIKIDRSFVANLGVRSESDAVVDAIVGLARALGLSVIAEGVETAEQAAHLTAAGCLDMQGYFFGKPVAPEEIDRLCLASQGQLFPENA